MALGRASRVGLADSTHIDAAEETVLQCCYVESYNRDTKETIPVI